MSSKSYATITSDLTKGISALRKEIPDTLAGFSAMHNGAMKAGALSEIQKELLALAESADTANIPDGMNLLGETFEFGGARVAYGVVLMLGLYLATWIWLRDTAQGRHIYAVGNSPEATRLAGISTEKVLLGVYVLAGVFYGIASALTVARTGAGDPKGGQTDNLDAITAVVLGGTSLFGGRGIILGTLIGAMIVGVFRNGLTLMGVSSVYQILVTGILVILAVATDQMSRKGGR